MSFRAFTKTKDATEIHFMCLGSALKGQPVLCRVVSTNAAFPATAKMEAHRDLQIGEIVSAELGPEEFPNG